MKILGVSFGVNNGNNDAMCKEALKGALNQGAEIEFINMQNLHIEHCTGCTACVMSLMSGRGGACVIKDDFDWFRSKMMDADGIVFSVPIFEEGATGLFHTITDRMGPRNDRAMNLIGTEIAKQTGGKAPDPRILKEKVVSFISVGGSDWSTRAQVEAVELAMVPAWKVIDNKLYPWSKCIAMEDDKLSEAYTVGENLAKATLNMEEATYQSEPGICPHCHSRNFYINLGDETATCCFCGMVGTLGYDDHHKIKFIFPKEMEKLAHDTVSGKFKHADDIKENEGKLMDVKKTDEYKNRMKAYKEFIQSSKPE